MEIYVARGACIELINADFKRKNFEVRCIQEQPNSSISLDQFVGGDIIDWSNSRVK